MKKFISSLTIIAFLVVGNTAIAQDCEPYFPTTEGSEMVLVNYNPKDKVESKSKQTVIKKTQEGNTLTFQAKNVTYDKKDEEVSSTEYTVKCDDGVFYIDISSIMMNNEQMSGYQGMEMTVDGDFIEIPANAVAGQTLPDAQMTINIGASGSIAMKMVIEVNDRKVEAIEDLETPAGTFKCVKLSYTTQTNMGPLKVKASAIDWYSKGVGMVKQEVYRKNGKLSGYTVLESFK